MGDTVFHSYFMGGFECSTKQRSDGVRLDLLEGTKHARHACSDYRAMLRHGLATVRDGLRWHLIEASPYRFDWSSFLPMLRASMQAGVQPIWDLCHYGWPSHIDIWSDEFPDRFARFAAAAARLVRDESDAPPLYCPINEISFWAWAGSDLRLFAPCAGGRGPELKRQLVRSAVRAIQAIRNVEPRARFVQAEPVIHIVGQPPHSQAEVEGLRLAQYEAWDMLAGMRDPELGGGPDCLDILGVNYYPYNQWFHLGPPLDRGDPAYRPFRQLLEETYRRYGRRLIVSETGAEGDMLRPWFRYVCDEVWAARQRGVPVDGVCLYPVTDYPGWDDGRHCPCGLLGYPDEGGGRPVNKEMAAELALQQQRFGAPSRLRTSGHKAFQASTYF